MKERPILFSGAMVRAILEGRKTQTRRVMKSQPKWVEGPIQGIGSRFWDFGWAYVFESGHVHTWDQDGIGGANWDSNRYPSEHPYSKAFEAACDQGFVSGPYLPGDRLWVRETFADTAGMGFDERFYYAADTRPGSMGDEARKAYGVKWTPSIHMPRAASRITLEISGVRVERLQDISEEDAKAEGVRPYDPTAYFTVSEMGRESIRDYEYRAGFAALWNALAVDETGWSSNPWVWVIDFKKI